MDAVSVGQCAELLVSLRTEHRTVAALPDGLRPTTEDAAYAVQDALHELGGLEIGALKVGCTGSVAQQMLGFSSPFGARVPAGTMSSSGSTIDRGLFHHVPYAEGEIAMQVAVDLHPTDVLPVDNIRTVVAAVAPAIELVDSRFDQMLGVDGLSLLADNGVAAALVLGDPVSGAPDLADTAVTVTGGGAEIASGSGAEVLGDPYRSLAWVLGHEQRRGRSVAAGTWVTTGTCTGLVETPLDVEIAVTVDGIGAVSTTVCS